MEIIKKYAPDEDIASHIHEILYLGAAERNVSDICSAVQEIFTLGNGWWQTLEQQETLPIACDAGCSYCCYTQTELTVPELIWLCHSVDLSLYREAILTNADQIVQNNATLHRRLDFLIPCSLLSSPGFQSDCSVHPFRPFKCRGHFSRFLQDCEQVKYGDNTIRLIPVKLAQQLYSSITAGVLQALHDLNLDFAPVELNRALAIVLRNPNAFSEWLAGGSPFASAAGNLPLGFKSWLNAKGFDY